MIFKGGIDAYDNRASIVGLVKNQIMWLRRCLEPCFKDLIRGQGEKAAANR